MPLEEMEKIKISAETEEALGIGQDEFTDDEKHAIMEEVAETVVGFDKHSRNMISHLMTNATFTVVAFILIVSFIFAYFQSKMIPTVFESFLLGAMVGWSVISGKKYKSLHRNLNIGVTSLIARETILRHYIRKKKGEKKNEKPDGK